MQEVQTNLPIGSVIRGRYIIEDLLGKGGFGAVYLVRDQRVRQNLFALKEVIDPNKRERGRFIFEAELLRRLDHPALPRVYHVFEDDKNDRAYMLMDYVQGPNLEKLRQRQPGKRFPVQQVLTIMAPIMNAVSYLHEQRPPIIHRDIKPANIIVPESGDETVLVDFGIAKEFDPESTTTAVRHASPGYGAPEQYGMGTNTRTDIYGLGATIYALLTGIVPADAFYRVTQLGSKGTDPLESIHQFAPDVPQHVADAIYHAMAVENNERFPTVDDFWQALLKALVPPPVVAPAPSRATTRVAPTMMPAVVIRPKAAIEDATTEASGKRPEGRRRKVGALLLLLLALLIGLASFALLLPSILGHPGTNPATSTATQRIQQTSTPVTHQSTPSHTTTPSGTPSPGPSPTPSPSPGPVPGYPYVAGNYNGAIIDNYGGGSLRANMSLAIQQGQGQAGISGSFKVYPPLSGSGPLTGFVTNKYYIQFLVPGVNGNPSLFFYGTVQQNGNLSGQYCSLVNNKCNYVAGGYGTWLVYPVSPGSSLVPSDNSISLEGIYTGRQYFGVS